MASRQPVVEMMDPMMVRIMREKTPIERLAIACGMWESARAIIGGTVRQQHPDWSEETVNQEIARRISHGTVDPGVVKDVES
jgi:hypothetical protein